jgi:predicted 3-demethylubiquinone-9 3-methyltransferase (glyoxalase superfamily)
VSFVVDCESQEEVDHYWDQLTPGGSEIQCGWLKDKFGLSWQVTPTLLGKLAGGDPKKAGKMMQALMTMIKLDCKALQKAYDEG